MDVGWDRGGPLFQPRREPGLSLRAAGGRGAVSRTAASDVIRLGQENAPAPGLGEPKLWGGHIGDAQRGRLIITSWRSIS